MEGNYSPVNRPVQIMSVSSLLIFRLHLEMALHHIILLPQLPKTIHLRLRVRPLQQGDVNDTVTDEGVSPLAVFEGKYP